MAASSKNPNNGGRRNASRPRDEAGRVLPFEPSEDQRRIVLASKSMGIENAAIARALGIDRDTLAKHFSSELQDARDVLHAKLAGKMVAMALDEDHKDCQRAGQFVLQSQFGWATQQQLNLGLGRGSQSGDPDEPSKDQVLPRKIIVEFEDSRPKGLPGGAAYENAPAKPQ